jgi:hypothetical protein
MIPPCSLPSDPSKTIYLRECSVADTIDFADTDAGHEEEVTTLFLNKIQDPEHYIDSLDWTAEDRRVALYWYWVHTAQPNSTMIKISYECDFCGGHHDYGFDFILLSEEYARIKGKAEREIEFNDDKVVVRPLNGHHMEALELSRLTLQVVDDQEGAGSKAYRRALAELKLEEFLYTIDFPGIGTKEDKPEDILAKIKAKVLAMTGSDFAKMAIEVDECLIAMEHGLKSEISDGKIYLLLPERQCPDPKSNGKEAKTQIRVPFRNSDYIPSLL